jgi:hypothetical protein
LALGLAIVKPLEALLSALGIDLPTGPSMRCRTIIVAVGDARDLRVGDGAGRAARIPIAVAHQRST